MQYPKMLCKGTQAEYEYQIANDEQHEDDLRKDGFDDYPSLPINADQASDQADQPKTNYEEITSEELRDLLEEKGIEFKARDSKATLIKLLDRGE
ncbi:hypothetical protein EJV31_24960 [Salmonella enterica]|nr:hypothetical protein [Salmonella enterica]